MFICECSWSFTWSSGSTSLTPLSQDTWGLGSPHTVHVKLRVCGRNKQWRICSNVRKLKSQSHIQTLTFFSMMVTTSGSPPTTLPRSETYYHAYYQPLNVLYLYTVLEIMFEMNKETRKPEGWTHFSQHKPRPWDTQRKERWKRFLSLAHTVNYQY